MGENPGVLSPVKLALADLREMRARLEQVERERTEPIAFVGLAGRFPGGRDVDELWELLRDGKDAIGDVPAERWDAAAFYDEDPDAPGKMYTRRGGFLPRVDLFDAHFFGVSPREAVSMDPQQRLLLETTWRALEHAAIAPARLAGTQTGVFVGLSNIDYYRMAFGDRAGIDAYYGSGTSGSVAAGRISYVLGLRGPSLVVDTACSSSLVAAHLACQSLRNRECDLALAGGVNLILSPDINIACSKARMMAPDGLCKTFDARADGYVRSEGCAVVVLKRLADAERDGDRILAVIRGSAVNQDGRSSGLTVPNGPAQEAVIRRALEMAGVEPSEVAYVEAHGTGTALGDPIEVRALAQVFADRAGGERLAIGSIKANVGHLEAAAGIAGLVKVVLAIERGALPGHPHLGDRNPHLDWDSLPLTIPTGPQPWSAGGRRRIAGVSSFGFSGTNAHVIVEEPPATRAPVAEAVERTRHLLTLSARTPGALDEVAADYEQFLGTDGVRIGDVCASASAGRSHFAHRLAVVGATAREIAESLAEARAGRPGTRALGGVADAPGAPEVVFMFTGQGSQYAGMGRVLYDTQPTFRRALDRCDEWLRARLGQSLLPVIFPASGQNPLLDETEYTQPALFAIEHALCELWRSWGVEPAALIGHSIGEYVAACAAGVFSLEDALKLVAARSRLMQALPRDGAMAAVWTDAARVEAAVARDRRLAIAAINGPENTVISGARAAVDAALERLGREGIKAQRLSVSHAFHSPLMEPMLDEFERIAEEVAFAPPRIPLVSNLTGEVAKPEELTRAAYWRRHAREAVRFEQGVETLRRRGHRVFVEIGPTPTLLGLARRIAADDGALFLPSLRKGRDDWEVMLGSVAQLYVQGAEIDWAAFDRDYARRRVTVPGYPFQRERYWITPVERAASEQVPEAAHASARDWFYEIRWRLKPNDNDASKPHVPSGTWMILGAGGGLGAALGARFEQAGACVLRGAAVDADPGVEVDVDQLLARLGDERCPPLAGVVYLAALDGETDSGADSEWLARALRRTCGGLLRVVQRLVALPGSRPSLWIVTRGASVPDAGALVHGPVWGLARTVAAEHPELHCVCIDLDAAFGAADLDLLWREISVPDGEDQVAFRERRRHVARLARAGGRGLAADPHEIPAQAGDGSAPSGCAARAQVRSDGTFLITGGLGGLGLRIARALVDRGARHLVLMGRRGPGDAAREVIAALEREGASVLVAQGDVSRQEDVAQLLRRIDADLPPLRGVVHAAGTLDDGVLVQQDWGRFETVLAPKVAGAWHLHCQTEGRPLDFFVLFSSAASLLGSAGQGNYTTANAFLDALAQYRHHRGLPALAINWGPWSEAGMAAGLRDRERRRWERYGTAFLTADQGVAAFEQALEHGGPQLAVLKADWRALAAQIAPGRRLALVEELVSDAIQAPAAAAPDERPPLCVEVERAPEDLRRDIVLAHVRDQIKQVLALEAGFVLDPRVGLRDLGLDSLMALELRNRLQRSVGRSLPATLAFDCPSAAALADYLATQVLSIVPPATATAARAVAVPAVPQLDLEPIAVVGIGCRFPGSADTPDRFWRLLRDGVDAIREVPPDRWDIDAYYDPDPDAAGKMYTRFGGFLDAVDRFDPNFFGISPREAVSLDPQQRLLLEVAWEALEHAGQAPDRLLGTRSGVFVGISTYDYALLHAKLADFADAGAYFGTGTALSVAAGRIAYSLGLQGPCMAVDTACSSSLVAIHLACESLRRGQCRLALAGGVNLMLAPEPTIVCCRARMLASDGRCKTFDAGADGYVRAEGAGVVVLKRLSDALADRDRILAVVRGTAVNQDGRSSGLTVPNGPAQQAVIRAALQNAGVAPDEVGYIEAHGTGTSLGDPIEVQALKAVFADRRPSDRPLVIGSVKTNIGHLEAAAGIAGLIKTVLALEHGEVPSHLHFCQLNPNIALDDCPILIATEPRRWPAGAGRRIAGVSSFGFSGTNAHVVLEEPPVLEQPAGMERPAHLLALSARNDRALRELADRYVDHLATTPDAALGDLAFTANAGRAQFAERLAVVAEDIRAVADALAAYRDGRPHPALRSGRAEEAQPQVAFLFTGQGAQYPGMARQLFETQPIFRRTLERCEEILRDELDTPLLSVLYPSAATTSATLDQTVYAQPALFALEYALAELWQSWGIRPAAVLGHSVGEYVAACVAGVFTLEAGLRLIARRGRLMQALPGGAMAAAFGGVEQVTEIVRPYPSIDIAAINGPDHVVISGAEPALEAALRALAAAKIRTDRLTVSHAFHSAAMDPMLDGLEQAVGEIQLKPPRLPLASNVTGAFAGSEIATAEYWRRHARMPVQFAADIDLLRQRCTHFLEIGPKPTLLGMARRCAGGGEVACLPSLRPRRGDWAQMLESLAALFVAGAPVDWEAFDRPHPRRKVALPTYPFQRQRYWVEGVGRSSRRAVGAATAGGAAVGHPLLGTRLCSPALRDVVFDVELELATLPCFHRVHGAAIVPGSVLIEMLLAASEHAGRPEAALEQLEISEALVLPDTVARPVQIVARTDGDQVKVEILSADARRPDSEWIGHARATLAGPAGPSETMPLEDIRKRCSDEIAGGEYYESLSGLGLTFDEKSHTIARIWRRPGEALAEVCIPPDSAGRHTWRIDPVVLDACITAVGAAWPGQRQGEMYLLTGVGRFEVYGRAGARAWAHVELDSAASTDQVVIATLRILDEFGMVLAAAERLQFHRAVAEALPLAGRELRDWLYELGWEPKPLASGEPASLSLPSVSRIVDALRPELTTAIDDRLLALDASVPRLEALSTAYVVRALRKLGWQMRVGERVTVEALDVDERLGPHHHRLLRRMVDMLAEDDILRRVNGGWEVCANPIVEDPEAMVGDLAARYPHAERETALIARCGARLPEVFQGRADPLELLFPGGSLAAVEQLYEESPLARVYQHLMGRAVAEATASVPADRTIAILEVGAGTGATTSAVLSALEGRSVRYVFTDLSPHFTERAARKFGAYSFVEYRALDLERDPIAQGFAAGAFDVIVAANVLHATRDLRETLKRLRRLLAPGGLVAIVEAVEPRRWLDITFGLTDGWWRFADADVRVAHPLVDRATWLKVLRETGFAESATVPDHGHEGSALGSQALLLARARPERTRGEQDEPARESARWLICADSRGVGAALADRLRERGDEAVLLVAEAAAAERLPGAQRVDPSRRDDVEQALRDLVRDGRAPRGVVHLWTLDIEPTESMSADDLEHALMRESEGLLHLVQGMAASAVRAPLWIVTRHAQRPVVGGPEPIEPTHSAVWGLGRVVSLEHPEIWGGLVDVDDAPPETVSAVLLREIADADGEDQVAWRSGTRYVARLGRSKGVVGRPTVWRPDASYLVTGGLGNLGLTVARWLAEQGARHLTLVSRKGLGATVSGTADPELTARARAVEAIERLGATVDVVAADVADFDQMARVIGRFGTTVPPLRGVVHAAATFSPGAIARASVETLDAVLRPKAVGAWVLHRLIEGHDLDFFVLFSSMAGLLGAKDLGPYAAANAFLDALAHHRLSRRLPALAVAWGAWDRMRGDSAGRRIFEQSGLRPMAARRALATLGHLLQADAALAIVASVDWSALVSVFEARRRRPLFDRLRPAPARGSPEEKRDVGHLRERIERARPQQRRELLLAFVREEAGRVLGLEPSGINPRQGLFDMGLDSLMAVEFKARLERALRHALPTTLTFNYPTVEAIAGFLLRDVPDLAPPPSEGAAPAERGARDPEDERASLTEEELASLLAEKLAGLGPARDEVPAAK